jgi:peptidoglycan/xylan/chitin deacetylase (PgdA/CDA1 family)
MSVSSRRVTLSFDNGPSVGGTEQVLDILADRGITADFFVIGSKLQDPAARRLAERAVHEGHLLGGHTWSHATLFGLLDDDAVDRELDDTRRLVESIGGDGRRFRPYGRGTIDSRLMSPHGARRLRDDGYTCVLWSSVPGDWRDPTGWPEVALADVRRREWSVVVLHDLPGCAVDRLESFLDELVDLDVELVTESPDDLTPIRAGSPTRSYELLGVGPPTPDDMNSVGPPTPDDVNSVGPPTPDDMNSVGPPTHGADTR